MMSLISSQWKLDVSLYNTRGDEQIRGKVPPFLYPLINSDKLLIYNRATHMQLIGHKNSDVSRPCALQPSSR